MKRYRLKVGDLKIVEEHPAGDLISLKELKEQLGITGDTAYRDPLEHAFEIADSLIALD